VVSVTYQGSNDTLTSGAFPCSTTTTDGTGTQANGIYLQYGQQKKVKWYRDSTTVVVMGRGKPATEVGQYQFRGMDLQYRWPANGKDIAGNAVTAAQMETALNNLVTDLQNGKYIQIQDAKGRNLYGVVSQDPEITDEIDQLVGMADAIVLLRVAASPNRRHRTGYWVGSNRGIGGGVDAYSHVWKSVVRFWPLTALATAMKSAVSALA